MRYAKTVIIALGLVLVASPAAWAGTSNDEVEVHDPEGDAGPAGAPLGPAAANFDILSVDFATEANTTTAAMELAAFDARPHETVYGIAYELDGTSFVWFGYGNMIFPFPPFDVEGYYGCHITEDDETCQELEGEERTDAPGFRVTIPSSWAPPNATLEDPMAAVFHDPFLPHPAGQVWWQTVWPHNTEDMAGPGESYEVPGNATADTSERASSEELSTAASVSDASAASLGAGTLGALAAGSLGALGLAGAAIRRR